MLLVIFAWNLAVFFLYLADKNRSRRGRRRIPESTLITCTICLGGIGGTAGMAFLRHKTRKLKFRILNPLALLVTVVGAALIFYCF